MRRCEEKGGRLWDLEQLPPFFPSSLAMPCKTPKKTTSN
jgi:hypothetical protein